MEELPSHLQEELDALSRVTLAEYLAYRFNLTSASCRLQLTFAYGHLLWVAPSWKLKVPELERLEEEDLLPQPR